MLSIPSKNNFLPKAIPSKVIGLLAKLKLVLGKPFGTIKFTGVAFATVIILFFLHVANAKIMLNANMVIFNFKLIIAHCFNGK